MTESDYYIFIKNEYYSGGNVNKNLATKGKNDEEKADKVFHQTL